MGGRRPKDVYNKGSCSQESYHSVRVVVLNQRQFRPPRVHLEISGDVFGCHDGKCAVPLLASRR